MLVVPAVGRWRQENHWGVASLRYRYLRHRKQRHGRVTVGAACASQLHMWHKSFNWKSPSCQYLHYKLYGTFLVTIMFRLFQEQFADQKAGPSCSKNNEVSTSLSSQVHKSLSLTVLISSNQTALTFLAIGWLCVVLVTSSKWVSTPVIPGWWNSRHCHLGWNDLRRCVCLTMETQNHVFQFCFGHACNLLGLSF